MAHVYLQYMIKSQLWIIPNIFQTLLTDSKYLYTYLGFQIFHGAYGSVIYLWFDNNNEEKSKGIRSGVCAGQQAVTPLSIQLFERLLLKSVVTRFV